MFIPDHKLAVNERSKRFFYLDKESEESELNKRFRIVKTDEIFNHNQGSKDCIANSVLTTNFSPKCPKIALLKNEVSFEHIGLNKYLFYSKNQFVGNLICNDKQRYPIYV